MRYTRLMAQQRGIVIPGVAHHVTQRGNKPEWRAEVLINSYCPEWHLLKPNWSYSLRLRFLTPQVVLSRIAKDSSRIS